MIKIEFNQSELRGGQRLSKDLQKKIQKVLNKKFGKKAKGVVSVAFVSPTSIRRFNRWYRRIDKVTDVLSFSSSKKLPHEEGLGEVLICYKRATKQAKDMRVTIRREVISLVVHGFLHLMGYRDKNIKDAEKMIALQEQLVDKILK